jgi:hypothetical protein
MLVHSVFFWLKADVSEEKRAAFRAGLERLKGIPTAKAVYIGAPAATPPRPVIDMSYTFALTVIFDDLAGQDVYQVHPLHQDFLKNFAPCWEKVQIYDAG